VIMYVIMIIPTNAGAVRYIIDSKVMVAPTGNFELIYMDDSAENNPMNILLKVTTWAGENWGIVGSIVGHLGIIGFFTSLNPTVSISIP